MRGKVMLKSIWFVPAIASLVLPYSLLTLTGCGTVTTGDSIFDQGGRGAPMAPVPPPVIDGYGNPAPELQGQYQETPTDQVMAWNASDETREWHGAVSRSDCDRIEKALQNKGLDIYLADRQPTGDPNLPWACIFEGNDADPSAPRFQDRRYENRDESQYP
jgi:hypothetical protein